MSRRTDLEFLSDIREAINRISHYVAGLSYELFTVDTRTQDAVVRNLEIIGEATKNLSAKFRSKHASIPWNSMARARDRLIHHYFGVNLDVVWDIVTIELPRVVTQLENLEEGEEA